MLGEERDVFTPVTQRGQVNMNRVEAEEQVLAKLSGGDLGLEVGVGGGDEADVDAISAGGTDAFEFTGFEHAQDFRLLAQRDRANLVHEQRTAIGEFEAAGAIGFGVGERSADVAEEFAFKNAFGQTAHVDGDKRFCGAGGNGVQRLGHEPFAGAIFTGDENVGVGGTDAGNNFQHRAHRGRLGDQVRTALAAENLVFLFEPLVGAYGATEVDLVFDDGDEPRILPRLGDKIFRAAPHGFDRDFDTRPSRHDHDGQSWIGGLQFREEIETFLAGSGVARIIEVDDRDGVITLLDGLQGGTGGFDGVDDITFRLEEEAQGFQHIGLVIGDENAVGRWIVRGHSRGSDV